MANVELRGPQEQNHVVVSVATTCSEALSHATTHRLDERCDLFWTQLGPLFLESLAKIVGRGDVVLPRDVILHQATNVLDRLHVRRICALEQQIDAFHLSERGRGVRCVRSCVVQINVKIAMAKQRISHRQDVFVQSHDYAFRRPCLPWWGED